MSAPEKQKSSPEFEFYESKVQMSAPENLV